VYIGTKFILIHEYDVISANVVYTLYSMVEQLLLSVCLSTSQD